MEIDITSIFNADTWSLSGSIATHGANAGPATWAASQAYGRDNPPPLLSTEAQLDAFRDHMRGFGAWDRKEIASWDADHCNALFAQLIAGDKREASMDDVEIDDDARWAEYEADASAGQCSGNMYRSGDKVFYYLGD